MNRMPWQQQQKTNKQTNKKFDCHMVYNHYRIHIIKTMGHAIKSALISASRLDLGMDN